MALRFHLVFCYFVGRSKGGGRKDLISKEILFPTSENPATFKQKLQAANGDGKAHSIQIDDDVKRLKNLLP